VLFRSMDDEIKQHIFEPFYTTKEEGTGLGLSVVYGIVKKHDGWVEVASEINKGSVFSIYIPAIFDKHDEKISPDKNINSFNGNGRTILLVEDDENVLDFTKTALVKNGYSVVVARNSKEALELTKKDELKIDLLLSDVILPDSSGIQLAEELSKLLKNLKILLSSGYSEQKSQSPEIIKKGFNYIQKPYTMYEMLKSLYEIINEEE
jgi:two-component system cell cycle sensor histidine kinase/response regulator CckA